MITAGAPSDVCLVVEGTYPYVTGGVSSWVHRLIEALPELQFSLLHVAASRSEEPEPVYQLPRNVVDFRRIGIHGGDEEPTDVKPPPPGTWKSLRSFHDELLQNHTGGFADILKDLVPQAGEGQSTHELIYGKGSWNMLRDLYESRAANVSFVDYFWTWRFTHLPIFRLLHADIPTARVYHTVTTGWAGLAATIARARTQRPMILTEHGIYARERRLEIDQAEWIYVQRQTPMTRSLGPGFFKELWTRLFYRLSRITYAHADLITTIFEGNRRAQIEDGADPARTLVIPNGVNVERFAALERVPRARHELRVGFVGRIVPIKDVKTFIRAFKIVSELWTGARALLVGPTDEDAEYTDECRTLIATLGLDQKMTFTGNVDVTSQYPRLDILVLTSVSEGLPLVMLEAMAAGIPVVTTDVGACRELLEGTSREDRALGHSGLVTGLADPGATAQAILALANDPGLAQEMGRVGQLRTRTYYREASVIQSYRNEYARLMMPARS